MKCVICKTGEVQPGKTQVEVKASCDRLLVRVEADVCPECGEAYYTAETLRSQERMRSDFEQKAITPPSVGKVYQVS